MLVLALVLLAPLPGTRVEAARAVQAGAPQAWLAMDPAVPVVGHKSTVYLYTAGEEVAGDFAWDVRARAPGGGPEMPVAMRRVSDEPRFWRGEIIFPREGEWQIVAGSLHTETWPAAGTTAGNLLVPVVSGKSALAPNDFDAPWELVMASGAAGVLTGAILGLLIGRKRG